RSQRAETQWTKNPTPPPMLQLLLWVHAIRRASPTLDEASTQLPNYHGARRLSPNRKVECTHSSRYKGDQIGKSPDEIRRIFNISNDMSQGDGGQVGDESKMTPNGSASH
ncbi:hypothetical protein HJC23_011931, partial [Cyclotella cryptica]